MGYCGLNCKECKTYIATVNNDNALRESEAKEWTRVFNREFTKDMMNCTGCEGDGEKVWLCKECKVRECAISKGVSVCKDCKDYPCETIKAYGG